MYNILPESKHNIIVLRFTGDVGAHDMKTLLPYLKNRIRQHGKIRMIVELNNFSGIQILYFVKIIHFYFKNGKHVEKKAVISDEKWIYTWVNLLSLLFKTKMRCFPVQGIEKAWDWIKR